MYGICAFNKNHRMPIESVNKHNMKCFRSYRATFSRCSYNASHYVKKSEMQNHMQTCVDRDTALKILGGMDGVPRVQRYYPETKFPLDPNWEKWGRVRAPVSIDLKKGSVYERPLFVERELCWAYGLSPAEKAEHARRGAMNYIRKHAK